jgi:three-Cys-motif partner protein
VGFWTEHKLDILSAYLNGFTSAAKNKASSTVYLDLFAGQAQNESRLTGLPIDGSAVRALRATPPLSTVVLFELPPKAAALRAKLTVEFPGRDIPVLEGDCNLRIDAALARLSGLRWAPTFAFIDQQGAEIRWETLVKLARHKRGSQYKVELWLLFAAPQLPRGLGVKRETDEGFARRVDAMLGCSDWREAYQARLDGELDGTQFRVELTNWMRWRLEQTLGCRHTHAFELRNVNGAPVYSMVFARTTPPVTGS